MKIAGGVHGDIATASIAVNSIPKILDVAPGLHTMRDMPLPSFFSGVIADPRGVAPRTPRHALSRAASPARSGRVARSHAVKHRWSRRRPDRVSVRSVTRRGPAVGFAGELPNAGASGRIPSREAEQTRALRRGRCSARAHGARASARGHRRPRAGAGRGGCRPPVRASVVGGMVRRVAWISGDRSAGVSVASGGASAINRRTSLASCRTLPGQLVEQQVFQRLVGERAGGPCAVRRPCARR